MTRPCSFKNMRLCTLTVCCGEMADCGADAGKQLGSAEWLCDIIVWLLRRVRVPFLSCVRAEMTMNRHGGPFADFFKVFMPSISRQAEVEE